MANQPAIDELAQAVADGQEVDWARAESAAETGSDREVIFRLKRIDTLVHRRRHLGDGVERDTSATGIRPSLPRWGHLSLIEKIGEGAFGEVYRARDSKLARDVALKLLRSGGPYSGRETTVIEEGRLLARVRHPNVVTVFGADFIDRRAGIWMEFVGGRTLETALKEHGRFGAREASLIGLDLTRALAAVHRAGLVHGDVKAHNVIREDGGRLVLMDFGAGREREGTGGAAENLTGTPLYLAPEILQGEPASVRSDVYSLGILLYHLVTGSYPIAGASLQDVMTAHRDKALIRLRDLRPELPTPFVQVVERATASDPAARYATAGAMEAALAESLSPAAAGSAPKPRLKSLAMATLAVLAAAATWWLLSRPSTVLSHGPGGRINILVGDFQGSTDEPSLPTVIADELHAIMNSEVVYVVGPETISDTLRMMKRDPATKLDVELARQVCIRNGGINAFIAGTANQIGTTYVLVAEVFNAADGKRVGEATATADSKADLLPAIQRLASGLREAVGEGRSQISRSDAEIQTQVTTSSLEAFKAYNVAYRKGDTRDWPAALESVDEALHFDPDFAMAHIWRAWALWNLKNPEQEWLGEAKKALALKDSVQEWERYWIEGSALWLEDKHAEAAVKFEALLRVDPTHPWAMANVWDYLRENGRDPGKLLPYLQAAADLRPFDFSTVSAMFEAAEGAGRIEPARAYAKKEREVILNDPKLDGCCGAWTVDAWVDWYEDRVDLASTELARVAASIGSLPPHVRTRIADDVAHFAMALGQPSLVDRVAEFVDNPQSRAFLHSMAAYWREDYVGLGQKLPTSPSFQVWGPLAQWPQDPETWTAMFLSVGRDDDAERLVEDRERRMSGVDFKDVLRARILTRHGLLDDALPKINGTRANPEGSPFYLFDRAGALADVLERQGKPVEAAAALRAAMWNSHDSNEAYDSAPYGMRNLQKLAELDRGIPGKFTEANQIEEELRRLLSQADLDYPPAIRVGAVKGAPTRHVP
jgi:serine/threonine protein kinase/tetratricopeptide (TPR) repeat protein